MASGLLSSSDGSLDALGPITDAVEAGAGLPQVLRAAARALDCSLVLIDRSSTVLAVAARSPAEERSLLNDRDDVDSVELKVADNAVGVLRLRSRQRAPDPSLLRLVSALIASEMERTRGPELASLEAAASFQDAVLRPGGFTDAGELVARGREIGIDLGAGGGVIVVRAHPRAPTEDDWRARLHALGLRGARSVAPGSIASADPQTPGEIVVLVADADGEAGRRACAAILRELESGLPGFTFALGRSRHTPDPRELPRAAREALLAANVVEGDPERVELGYEETGTYQLLLPHMSDPAELRHFFEDTVLPLVTYDEQYETDLLGTLAAFLECDANVNATAARLFTHRHTVRYRFERVRDLTGLDVSSSDGREKLSLGLKAMRVLGIAPPRGPATEPGAEAGRVPR